MKPYLDFKACKWCGLRLNDVVPPEIPEKPDIILVGESPNHEDLAQHKLFVGEAGQLIRAIVREQKLSPLYVNARSTEGSNHPTTEELKIERESHLLPLLADYPGVPVVALGKYAAMALLGGQQNEKKRAGEVLWLYDRPVIFTFNPGYYFVSGNDDRVLEHIALHIAAAVRPIDDPQYFLDKFTGFLKHTSEVVIDVETDDDNYPWYDSGTVVLGVLPVGGIAHVFTRAFLSKAENLERLNRILRNSTKVIGHSLMFDLIHSEYIGADYGQAAYHDTLIYAKNLGVEELSLGLKFFAKRMGFPPYEAKFHAVLRDKSPIREMPIRDLASYNARDLYATEQLYLLQKDSPGLFAMDMEYLHYVKKMTQNGLHVSKNKLDRRAVDLNREKDKLEGSVRRAYKLGKDFNFNSPVQIRSLFNQLGVDLPDTGKQTLLDHFDEHPFVAELIDIRKVNKALGKVKEIRSHLTKRNVLHSKMSVHGTETSRLASKEPNIENFDVPMKDVISTRY